MERQIEFEERMCTNGIHKVAIATLNNPKSLNALTYDMLDDLNAQLERWRDDPYVMCVWLQGSGDKAFCAGGDVRAMHTVMSATSKQETREFCTRYFTLEYQCDHLIHTFPKPIIAWGDGIVMGGGMGLFMGASHKVVTPRSKMAMPEMAIGLFPDVGATWFLNRLDHQLGLFVGLTGCLLNATDALELGLANHMILQDHGADLLNQLKITDWDTVDDHYVVVSELLEELAYLADAELPESQLMPYLNPIMAACAQEELPQVAEKIASIEPLESDTTDWLIKAQQGLATGSPITAHICFRQLRELHEASLVECFQVELGLAVQSSLLGEFEEGVRARLVDKDGSPSWMYKSIEAVDESIIDDLFSSLWTEQMHPLKSLGTD